MRILNSQSFKKTHIVIEDYFLILKIVVKYKLRKAVFINKSRLRNKLLKLLKKNPK